MALYIVKDAADDFEDVMDGVKEMSEIFNDPTLSDMYRQLAAMKRYVENKKNEVYRINLR